MTKIEIVEVTSDTDDEAKFINQVGSRLLNVVTETQINIATAAAMKLLALLLYMSHRRDGEAARISLNEEVMPALNRYLEYGDASFKDMIKPKQN